MTSMEACERQPRYVLTPTARDSPSPSPVPQTNTQTEEVYGVYLFHVDDILRVDVDDRMTLTSEPHIPGAALPLRRLLAVIEDLQYTATRTGHEPSRAQNTVPE